MWSAVYNYKKTVFRLLDFNVELNVQDKSFKQTALFWAVKQKNKEIANKLIDVGANVKLINKYDMDANIYASRYGFDDIV